MWGRRRAAAPAVEKRCRCEATVAPAVLDGFACGRADCWRTAAVQAAQDRFTVELIRRREEERDGKLRSLSAGG